MKVIFCKWTSICEAGFDRGLVTLGYDVRRITRLLDSVDYDMEYADLLSDTLKEFPADCVMSINFIPIIARVCKIHKVPYICQIVDSPCFQLYSETVAYETNHIFIFDRDLYNKFKHKNPTGIHKNSLASDIEFWDKSEPTEAERRSYSCDISFVGSLYNEKSMYNKAINNFSDYVKGYVDAIVDAQCKLIGMNIVRDSMTPEFVKLFKEEARWIPLNEDYEVDDAGIVANTYIGYKCTERNRIQVLNALAEHFHVDLYTQSPTDELKGVNVRGPADSSKMMPQIMKSSKINLNLTNIPISSGLPLRCFDIMGSGGFMMSNYQAELPEIFEPDIDFVMFGSIPELLEKTAYYLEHDEEREAIACHGYEKVKEFHSYPVKIRQMVETVFGKEI